MGDNTGWSKSMWTVERHVQHDGHCNQLETSDMHHSNSTRNTEDVNKSGHPEKLSQNAAFKNKIVANRQETGSTEAPSINGLPKAARELENQTKTTSTVSSFYEPLAIIGMAFQFPGGAVTEETFWEMLVSQQCASSDFPTDRMNIDAFYNADTKKANVVHTRKAHFLDYDIRGFDAHHFNIPPSEAGAMDPCQRGLMETTYHALENAGLPVSVISGSNASVHVGFFSSDYMTFNLRDPLRIPKYYATGSSTSILSNRISWHYNLHGPSMTIDTACSSGLVAMDLACQGLWAGTSDLAIVGAANLILSPELNIALSNMNFLSPDGKCYSFDSRASGYARGEGFSAIILKPLSKALSAGDCVRGLVRSIGSNQDGHTRGGLTQPSRDMQAKLIRDTYVKAGLDMQETRFFEAHGTGTLVGDPAEARAIGESFRQYRTDNEPLYVGAVKSNIGHLEGASGLAGVIKAVLALEKGVIPPNTNFEVLNPRIDDEFFRLNFPRQCTPWPASTIRRASVNSFGFGGSNAHVVLDSPLSFFRGPEMNGSSPIIAAIRLPMDNIHGNAKFSLSNVLNNFNDRKRIGAKAEDACSEPLTTGFSPTIVILSSSAEAGIAAQVRSHGAFLQKIDTSALPSYSYTLALRRNLLSWRSFGVINSPNDLSSLPSIMSKPVQSLGVDLKLGIVFTGQGAQWFGMGRELLSVFAFSDSMRKSQSCLRDLGCRWSLVERLTDNECALSIVQPEFSQTITTCLQLALFDMFTWLGVEPSVVIGHSSGEIAAAYAAGHLSRSSAVKVSYYRGLLGSRLELSCSIRHSMAAVGLSWEDATSLITALEDRQDYRVRKGSLTVSCINSPRNVTISGPESDLHTLIEHLEGQKVFTRKLKVTLGYHSPQMEQISPEYQCLIGELEPGGPHLTSRPVMISSVTGRILTGSMALGSGYWVRNMVSPVDFVSALSLCSSMSRSENNQTRLDSDAITKMRIDGWMEIGPHGALKGPIRETFITLENDGEIIYTSALVRNKSALSSVLAATGELHCRSFSVDMARTIALGYPTSPFPQNLFKVLPSLPKYQFDHSILYWEEPQANKNFRFRKYGHHDLLGTMVSEPNVLESQWKIIIKEEEMPWIRDHKVDGSILYPAAGMIVMAIEAAKQLMDDNIPVGFELEGIEFPAPIIIASVPEGVEVRIHLSLDSRSAHGETDYKFRIFLYNANNSHEIVCTGVIRGVYNSANPAFVGTNEDEEKVIHVQTRLYAAMASCNILLDSKEMYQRFLNDSKLDYGSAFQVLKDIRCNRLGEAVAKVLPRKSDSTTPHIIHPSRLDGIFQLGLVAASAMKKAKTMVPTFISRLFVNIDGLGHEERMPVTAFADVQECLDRSGIFNIKAVREQNMDLQVEVCGLEVTAVNSAPEVATSLEGAPWICSHIEWKPDVDTLRPEELQTYCETVRPTTAEPVDYFRDMDALVYQYGAQALAELDKRAKFVQPSMKNYAMWLRSHVEASSGTPLMTANELECVRARIHGTVRGELHIEIGERLVEFLSGEANPLETIFANEIKITEFYRELTEETTGIDSISLYLNTLVHKNPALRFMEVGAGTGGSTSVIMRTINNPDIGPRFEEYVYTDVSPNFFEQARRRFSQCPRMKYQELDVERDIEAQNFSSGHYDVIIADNVLHATSDVSTTLRNIRKLLCPGGKLLLKELVTPKRMLTGFAFGLLPGWWLSNESKKEMSPLLSVEQWQCVLEANGFSGIELQIPDHLSVEAHLWSMMICSAEPSLAKISLPIARPGIIPHFIVDPTSSRQKAVSRELAHRLDIPKEPSILSLTSASMLCSSEPGIHSFIFLVEMERSILREVQEEEFSSLQTLMKDARAILWVKQGGGPRSSASPDYGISDGLCRVARRENSNILVSLALEKADISSATNILRVFELIRDAIQLDSSEYEPEYIIRKGKLCVGRLQRAKRLDEHLFKQSAKPVLHQKIGSRKLKLGIRARGLLDTIQFHQDETYEKPLGVEEVDVEIRAIGVNYKDCLTLLGKFNSDNLGSECSGVVKAIGRDVQDIAVGDRVVVGAHGAFRTWIRVPEEAVVRIPDTMDFPEAASLFTAYCTAYYSLIDVARLQPTDSVLIHAAAGGTGQAMLQIARYIGAEVYATVGSGSKKDLLTQVYGVPHDHIFNSRDLNFAEGIKRMTGGRGVDVVVNSQQGRLLDASWDCVAVFGRFLDIGLKDAYQRGQLPMHTFTKNTSYSGINLNMLVEHNYSQLRSITGRIIDLFELGKLKPVTPLHCYALQDVEQALRFLQSGKSSGKIILKVDKTAFVPIVQDSGGKHHFRADATYVIAGGLGGIGRSIARRLVQGGAMNLILLSRSAGDDRARRMLNELRSQGVNVQCPTCDITDLHSLKRVLAECVQTMPPIRGCIQAAMVLRDAIFSKLSNQMWQEATQPKVQGSWNLHEALPPGMDFFILLSSVAAIFGNAGQSSYCAGNTYQDALARYRTSVGEKALALDVGVVLGEGYVAENQDVMDRLMRLNLFRPNSLKEIFTILEKYCNTSIGVLEPDQSQVVTGFELPVDIEARGSDVPSAMEQPIFRYMKQAEGSYKKLEDSNAQVQTFRSMFTTSSSASEGALVVAEALRTKLSRVMGLDEENIKLESTLDGFGVDSLVGLELRNWLSKESGADLAVFEILGGATLLKIGETVARKSPMKPEGWVFKE